MPYKLGDRTLQLDVAWVDDAGIARPANWLRLSTERDRELLGIAWVAETNQVWDQKFYWGYDADGNLLPKQLNDEPVLDEDGKDTGEVQTGLKTLWKAKQSEIAGTLIAPSDWRVIKAKETGTNMPSAWKTYRAAVRTACNTRQTEIDACSDVAALKELLFGVATIQQQKTDEDGKVVTETVTLQRQKTDEDGEGVVDSDGKAVLEDYTEEQPVMEAVTNPKLATAWPDPIS